MSERARLNEMHRRAQKRLIIDIVMAEPGLSTSQLIGRVEDKAEAYGVHPFWIKHRLTGMVESGHLYLGAMGGWCPSARTCQQELVATSRRLPGRD